MSVEVIPLALFAASQVGTPGPANMALMASGARFGLAASLPFVGGVVLGKQLIIWPLGLGFGELALASPAAFSVLKWAAAAYIGWLAWRIAFLRLAPGRSGTRAPGFSAGLVVHPLNPKAWAMIVAAFTGFAAPGAGALAMTATVAAVFLLCQIGLHPLWTIAGERVARVLAGTRMETYLMMTLALLTIASVALVLF